MGESYCSQLRKKHTATARQCTTSVLVDTIGSLSEVLEKDGNKETGEGHRRDLQGPIIGTHLRLGKRVYPVHLQCTERVLFCDGSERLHLGLIAVLCSTYGGLRGLSQKSTNPSPPTAGRHCFPIMTAAARSCVIQGHVLRVVAHRKTHTQVLLLYFAEHVVMCKKGTLWSCVYFVMSAFGAVLTR